MRKIGSVFALLLCLLLLAGCMEGGNAETVLTSQMQTEVTVQTTEPSVPSDPVTEPTVPVATEPLLEPVEVLSARNIPAEVCVLDERTVAFLSTKYVTELGKTVSAVSVLDLHTDEILAQVDIDRALAMPLQTYCPEFLPLFDYSSQTCTVYDATLQPIVQFEAPDRGGVFSADLSTYYYISAQRLYRMDIGTGQTEQIITDQALPLESIVDYDMARGRLLVNVHTEYYLTELCVGVIDLATGSYQILSREPDSAEFTCNGTALQLRTDGQLSSELIVADEDGSVVRSLVGLLPNSMEDSSWHIPATDLLVTLHYDVKNSYNYSGCTLYRIGQVYESCDLGALLGKLELKTVLALPDGSLLGFARSRRDTVPVIIRPELLGFVQVEAFLERELLMVDPSVEEDYAAQAQPVEVAQELAEVRAWADALEEEYGITVLISNQCQEPISHAASNVVTTDQAGLSNEAELIGDALKELEDALELYPEGFFCQFRNEADERGILVLLVQDINTGYIAEGYDVLGVSFKMDDWYPIAVDVTTWEMTKTFCHELWHATENKISSVDPTLFNDAAWNRINPSGFVYTENGGGAWGTDSQYTYLGGYSEESYFVDGYAKTSPKEDRARLMEYVMTSNYYSEELMKAPGLHQKMQVMSDAVRKVFDTEGWNDVRWERDL